MVTSIDRFPQKRHFPSRRRGFPPCLRGLFCVQPNQEHPKDSGSSSQRALPVSMQAMAPYERPVKKISQYRSAGALGCHTRIREGFPRECPVDRSTARDRPSPYGERGCSLTQKPSGYRSAGACPPRSFGRPQHGEGQALALRGRETVFRPRNRPVTVARGPVPRDLYRQVMLLGPLGPTCL